MTENNFNLPQISILLMKDQATSSLHQQSNDRPINRKPSFLKVPSTKTKQHVLQLPRFYSSDQKKPKKNIFAIERDQELSSARNSQKQPHLSKKGSFKYSKTEKNQTPTKLQKSIKTIKVTDQKWKQAMRNGMASGSEGKIRQAKKKSLMEQIASGLEKKDKQECKKNPSNGNLNRIRYKVNSHKRQQSQPRKTSKISGDGIQTQPLETSHKQIKSTRESKHFTEENVGVKGSNASINRATLKKEDQKKLQLKTSEKQFVSQSLKHQSRHSAQKLEREEVDYLNFMLQVKKKTIKTPFNLDFPQAYIVSDKTKSEKAIHNLLQQKFQPHFKMHIIYTRFTFYLAAHLILLSMNVRVLIATLNKLLQSQQIIAGMFGINQDKSSPKKYSHPKMTINQARKRSDQPNLAIQNRGNNIGKNNQLIRQFISGILTKTKAPYIELFQSLLISSDTIDSFQFIGFLDKTLKWQVLKMPSYPFLPPCVSHHSRYLILDLDQTLIHFDIDQDVFHVRPFAEEFIKKMSLYFQITIFTAGTKEYADQIINQIDKQGYVKHRLYRNHLTFLEGESVKDLSMLGRNMKNTLIIDNLSSNFRMSVQNGIEIKSWFNDSQDRILQKLEDLLIKIATDYSDDLRKGVRAYKSYIAREISEKASELKIKYKI